MFVQHRYQLPSSLKTELKRMKPRFGFDGYGEFIFQRTYSRKIGGKQETWADVVIRVVEGVFSIRKDWYIRNHIEWDNTFWTDYAQGFARYLFDMKWTPPGRGLWAMGTEYVYERGSMALYNCAFTNFGRELWKDVGWMMDCLMCGVGVGFRPIEDDLKVTRPNKLGAETFVIPDSREGWVESVELRIKSYVSDAPYLNFDYSQIRPAGLPIKGYGGTASGPAPLIAYHKQIDEFMERHIIDPDYSTMRLKADLGNALGCCVVAGNVRRTAEIMLGDINSSEFLDLKDYERYPERAGFGWVSNNSVILRSDSDFNKLKLIADRVVRNGEPGYVNARNLRFGRIGKFDSKDDNAVGINPCGEIPLEDKEVCNVAETNPTRCDGEDEWLRACEYAALYCTTVSMLPTHRVETNAVVARNRRIGVGITDGAVWSSRLGIANLTSWLREGYTQVRNSARFFNAEAGIPEPIRYTTIKPGGTTPKVAGCESGFGHPSFPYILRRVRVAKTVPFFKFLVSQGLPFEDCVNQPESTAIFSFPIKSAEIRPSSKVSLWEQAMTLVLIQREWADNAVSNTLNFRPAWVLVSKHKHMPHPEDLMPGCSEQLRIREANGEYLLERYDPNHEEDIIENVLAAIAPLTKSVALMPHTPKGVYAQSPEEEITEEQYNALKSKMVTLDWSLLDESDGMDTRFCEGNVCELPPLENNAKST